MTLISVVMPSYNAAATIAATIASVQTQTYQNYELIIVDDGSSDNTMAIIEPFKKDARIKIVQQPNRQGANAARNAAIAKSTGPIICFLDADDIFNPEKLAWIENFFAASPHVDVLIDSFELLHPDPKRAGFRRAPDLMNSEQVISGAVGRTINKPTPSISVRRPALLKAGGFDPSMRRRQDLDLLLSLAESGAQFASTSTVLWQKKWSPASITATSNTFLESLMALCRKHPGYITKPNYRNGLGLDLARHGWRETKKNGAKKAFADWIIFANEFGRLNTAALLVRGLKTSIVNRNKKSALSI